MIPLPSIPGPHSALITVAAVALAALAVTWIAPAPVTAGAYRLVRLIFRAAWWLIVRPRLSVPLAALGLVTWLAWPILGPIGGATGGVAPFAALGVVGALTVGMLVGRALIQQHRINADIDAQYAADGTDPGDGATDRTVPEWARE